MAAVGWKTLLIDLDPQGNASTGLGIHASLRDRSSYDLLVDGMKLADCIVPSEIPGLSVVPATVDLSGAEIELVAVEERPLAFAGPWRATAAMTWRSSIARLRLVC